MSNIKIADMDLSVNENSFAYKKANELGLKGTGFGYFINEDGKIIAVSTKDGHRLVILESPLRLQNAPPTDKGTKRFYYAASDGEVHIVTKKHAKSQGWAPARAKQVTKHKSDNPEKKAKAEDPKKGRRPAKKTKVKSKLQAKQDNEKTVKKDKRLNNVNTLKSKVYRTRLSPGPKEFAKKNKGHESPPPFKLPKIRNSKFPVKYAEMLEHMMNTKADNVTKSISHFTDGNVGAGQISSQAGELMVVAFAAMDDKEFEQVSSAILEHTERKRLANNKRKKEGKPTVNDIVDSSWVKAAMQNRKAIVQRIAKQYPPGTKIDSVAWDTEEEVEAMGLNDYKKNKGFSSDMYIKVILPNGESKLDEISLKKSTQVNFLNSGVTKFKTWDPDIPINLTIDHYMSSQRNRLKKGVNKFMPDLIKFLATGDAKAFKSIMKSKKINSLDDLLSAKGSRGNSKTMYAAIEALADNGNKDAEKFIKYHRKASAKFATDNIKQLTSNPKLKAGMLEDIKSEFPLKAVSEGEETMAIGPLSLDKMTMEDIFGTSDYKKIKENLVAETGPPPYIGYKAKVGGKIIPIAQIDIREDGIGYGGQFRFDMKLDPRFAKTLEQAHKNVYGE